MPVNAGPLYTSEKVAAYRCCVATLSVPPAGERRVSMPAGRVGKGLRTQCDSIATRAIAARPERGAARARLRRVRTRQAVRQEVAARGEEEGHAGCCCDALQTRRSRKLSRCAVRRRVGASPVAQHAKSGATGHVGERLTAARGKRRQNEGTQAATGVQAPPPRRRLAVWRHVARSDAKEQRGRARAFTKTTTSFPSSAARFRGSCWRAICVAIRCCNDRVDSLSRARSLFGFAWLWLQRVAGSAANERRLYGIAALCAPFASFRVVQHAPIPWITGPSIRDHVHPTAARIVAASAARSSRLCARCTNARRSSAAGAGPSFAYRSQMTSLPA